MTRLALLLSLVAATSAAGAQRSQFVVYPTCTRGDAATDAEPHDAPRALTSVHTVTTDGFGARYSGPTGRAVHAEGLSETTILDDGTLAWRTPTAGQIIERCPGALRVIPNANLGPLDGLLLAAEVGNETGDPGPLRYLDPSLPNVDKIGPDYEATLTLGPSLTSLRWRDFLPTDSAIAPRVLDALEGRFPKRKGLTGTTGLRFGPHTVEAFGLIAEDLPFEETLGREVPTLRRQLGGAASGWVGGTLLRATGTAAWLDRPSWSALSVPGPDWRETSADVRADRRLHGTALFARVRPIWASGPGLTEGSVLWAEAGGSRSLLSARVSTGPGGVGGGVDLAPRAWWGDNGLVIASAYAERQLPEAAPDLVFWTARGYSGLASEATPLALTGVPRPVERIGGRADASRWWETLDLLVDRQWSAGVRAIVDVEARRGETVLLPRFRLAQDAVVVNGPVQAVAAQGAAADAEVSARWSRYAPTLHGDSPVHTTVDAWARVRLVLAGDDAFRLARDREPGVRLGALAEHSPDGNLNLNARLEWRSATRWEGWPEPEIPAALLLDLSAERTFGVFTATLTGRNVLGAPEQTHPLGATLDGRLFVRLAARLGG